MPWRGRWWVGLVVGIGVVGLWPSDLQAQKDNVFTTYDFCVLETELGGETELVQGDPAVRHRRYCPASLFKIIIAWAGFERGVATPLTPYVCRDAPGGVEAELTLAQAMFFSSNDYFRAMGEAIGKPTLDEFAIKAGWLTPSSADGWLPEGVSGIERGGNMRVTPDEVHALTVKLMSGRLGSNATVQRYLTDALFRPQDGRKSEIFGKTGAWGGAAWMTGYGPAGQGKKGKKAVTVLVSYRVPHWRPARELALETFYKRLNQEPTAEPDSRMR